MTKLQWGVRRARRRGDRIETPRANEVQIDLDGLRAIETFAAQRAFLARYGLTRGWRLRLRPSASANHVHVVVRLPAPRPLRERVLLAALLGSDLKREGFNYVRVVKRHHLPVALFVPKGSRRALSPDLRRRLQS